MTMKQRATRAVALVFAAVLFVCLTAGAGFAAGGFSANQGQKAGGGFSGPGPAVMTVQQALSMRDDSMVTLRGNIVQHLGGEKYLFRDSTGAVTVEVDDDKWNGQTVGPDDQVEIHGEVDKDWNSVEVDVERLIKL